MSFLTLSKIEESYLIADDRNRLQTYMPNSQRNPGGKREIKAYE